MCKISSNITTWEFIPTNSYTNYYQKTHLKEFLQTITWELIATNFYKLFIRDTISNNYFKLSSERSLQILIKSYYQRINSNNFYDLLLENHLKQLLQIWNLILPPIYFLPFIFCFYKNNFFSKGQTSSKDSVSKFNLRWNFLGFFSLE